MNKEDILNQTRANVSQFIDSFPDCFGLSSELSMQTSMESPNERIAQLYQQVCDAYINHNLDFNHTWDWVMIWRQQLSFQSLAEMYGQEQVIKAVHPRARKAVRHMYNKELDKYMQWFPWSWFTNMQFIGAGGFSAVYSVHMTPVYNPQLIDMALKIVDDKLLNEISVQSKAFLPVLFQGLTVCESTSDLMMVMKLSNDGNLEDHMQQLPLGDLDLKTITGTILRLAANLADLHKSGMCHRNLHPRNIICTDSDYFIVDYRFATPSRESSSVTALTRAVYGRLPYVAPEVRQGIYTEKSDIYSLGIILWQLVSKVIFPSPDMLDDDVYRIEPVPGLPLWYQRLYVSCLEPDPSHRPDAVEISEALQVIHQRLEYSVPLGHKVAEYIVARRADVADHRRTFEKVKGIVSASTTRLYTLNNLPSTETLVSLPFENRSFQSVWNSL